MCPCVNNKTAYKDIRNKLIKSYINNSAFKNDVCKDFLKHTMQYTYVIINYWNIQQKVNKQFKHKNVEHRLEEYRAKKHKIEEYEECEEQEKCNKKALNEEEYYNSFVNGFDENFIQVTDIHGDLNNLLMTLVGNGYYVQNGILPCKFVDNEPPIIYFNINDGKIIKNPKYIFNYTNIIPIPNLEINPRFRGKFILNGDLIDKGLQSEVCFYTMYNILQQEEAKNKIFYLLGNHESLLISGNYDSSVLNTSSSFFSSGANRLSVMYNPCYYLSAENYDILKSRLATMSNYLKQLVATDKLTYSTVIGNVLFSHTYLNSDVVINLVDEFRQKNANYKIYDTIIDKLRSNEIVKHKNSKLTPDELKTLSTLLNKSIKSYINVRFNAKNGFQTQMLRNSYEQIFDRDKYNTQGVFLNNILWEHNKRHLIGNQIIGHMQTSNRAIQFEHIKKDNINVLHTDTARCRDISNNGQYSFLQHYKNELTIHLSNKSDYLYSSLLNIVHDHNLMTDVQLPQFSVNSFMPIRSLNDKLKDENDDLNLAAKEFANVLLDTAKSCNIIGTEQ